MSTEDKTSIALVTVFTHEPRMSYELIPDTLRIGAMPMNFILHVPAEHGKNTKN
jgi:hypothetical protein